MAIFLNNKTSVDAEDPKDPIALLPYEQEIVDMILAVPYVEQFILYENPGYIGPYWALITYKFNWGPEESWIPMYHYNPKEGVRHCGEIPIVLGKAYREAINAKPYSEV